MAKRFFLLPSGGTDLIRTLTICGLLVSAGGAGAGEPPRPRPSADVPARAIAALDALFKGPHARARAVHAKGVLCEGVFMPTAEARQISVAPHFAPPATPVLVRFSNFSGAPEAADNGPLASPRGIAIKFALPDGGDTDIVALSYDGFPVATPEDFVTFMSALAAPDARVLDAFVAGHPAARAFVEAEKPAPVSYATESFFGVNAFTFTDATGTARPGRYRIVPSAGPAHLDPKAAALQAPDYLAHDMAERLAAGEVRFRIDLQLANPGDQTADGSLPWPENRPVVTLGTLTLKRLAADDSVSRRDLFFTPLNLVEGILPSDDPMLDARSRAYRISHVRRITDVSASAEPPR